MSYLHLPSALLSHTRCYAPADSNSSDCATFPANCRRGTVEQQEHLNSPKSNTTTLPLNCLLHKAISKHSPQTGKQARKNSSDSKEGTEQLHPHCKAPWVAHMARIKQHLTFILSHFVLVSFALHSCSHMNSRFLKREKKKKKALAELHFFRHKNKILWKELPPKVPSLNNVLLLKIIHKWKHFVKNWKAIYLLLDKLSGK